MPKGKDEEQNQRKQFSYRDLIFLVVDVLKQRGMSNGDIAEFLNIRPCDVVDIQDKVFSEDVEKKIIASLGYTNKLVFTFALNCMNGTYNDIARNTNNAHFIFSSPLGLAVRSDN